MGVRVACAAHGESPNPIAVSSVRHRDVAAALAVVHGDHADLAAGDSHAAGFVARYPRPADFHARPTAGAPAAIADVGFTVFLPAGLWQFRHAYAYAAAYAHTAAHRDTSAAAGAQAGIRRSG